MNKNPRYSLRAFAKHIGVNVADLSKFMSLKRYLSASEARNVLNSLGLSEKEQSIFLQSFLKEYRKQQLELAERRYARLEKRVKDVRQFLGTAEKG